MTAAQRFFRLANERGATSLSCNENGVHLGCVPLLRRTDAGFEPRPSYEIKALIAKAYRGAKDGARLSSGGIPAADGVCTRVPARRSVGSEILWSR
jgi:hypothetical protein